MRKEESLHEHTRLHENYVINGQFQTYLLHVGGPCHGESAGRVVVRVNTGQGVKQRLTSALSGKETRHDHVDSRI